MKERSNRSGDFINDGEGQLKSEMSQKPVRCRRTVMRAIELPFLMIYNGTRTQVRLRVLITEHRSLVSNVYRRPRNRGSPQNDPFGRPVCINASLSVEPRINYYYVGPYGAAHKSFTN